MSNSTSSKIINTAKRLEILEKLEAAVSISELACEYGVTERSIRRYRQQSDKIKRFAANEKNLDIKRHRAPANIDLETQLYNWFVQRRLLGDYVTDNVVIEKAKQLQTEISTTSNFKASRGWLWAWKKRYDIRLVAANANEVAARNFITEFTKFLREEDIEEEDVYNMDETSLFWKALPQKLLIHKEEHVKERNMKKEKITVAFCANASGNHKLPILFIHKYANPRALKHCMNSLPVTYKVQQNAWVNENIFREWYREFKQFVRQRQSEEYRDGKVLLLVDNFKSHKLKEEELDDGHFKLMFLPPNTSSIIQPMDQGIIAKCKKLFRHKLLRQVLRYDEDITKFYSDYDIKDCIDLINETWNEVTPQNIYRSWAKLLNHTIEHSMTKPDTYFGKISVKEVAEWISKCEKAECEKTESIIEVVIIKEENSNERPVSPVEEEDIDRMLYNLQKLSKTEPGLEPYAKGVIDYFTEKKWK